MFGLENIGETLIFRSHYFDEIMTILISHFLRFGSPNKLTVDYFVIRIPKLIYSKPNIWCFILFSIFPSSFPTVYFPIHLYRVAYKWRMNRMNISASKWLM